MRKTQQGLAHALHAFARDGALAPALCQQYALNGLERARGPHGLHPVAGVKGFADMGDFDTGAGIGRVVVAPADLPVLEVTPTVRHAAHLQAGQVHRLEALADGELGAAAADVHHQARARVVGQRVRHAEVDQAGFLASVNDLYRGAEDTPRRFGEIATIARAAQRVGADHANSLGRHAVQKLGETAQAVQAAFDGGRVETVIVHAGGELDFFRQRLRGANFAVFDAGDDQVEGVAAQIHGGQQAAVAQPLARFVGHLLHNLSGLFSTRNGGR